MLVSFDLEVPVIVIDEIPGGDWFVVEHLDFDCVARVASPTGRGLATDCCQEK